MEPEVGLLNFTSFSEYFHTSVPSKLIFVFVLNLMQVDITDRQYLTWTWTKQEKQQETTGHQQETNTTILKLPEKLKSI